jgi:hypothetical protein
MTVAAAGKTRPIEDAEVLGEEVIAPVATVGDADTPAR